MMMAYKNILNRIFKLNFLYKIFKKKEIKIDEQHLKKLNELYKFSNKKLESEFKINLAKHGYPLTS